MIKKFLLVIVVCMFFVNTVSAEVFQYVGAEFDWAVLNKREKNERVANIFRLMFPTGKVVNYSKRDFKSKYKNYLKDKDYKTHYDAVVAGYNSYKNVVLEGYYYKNTDNVYMYALQYKNKPEITFYYSALGRLKFIDLRYGDLKNCPCYIKKYSANGKLKRAAYVQSSDIIYTYGAEGEFEGVQYKSTMYTH